MARHLLAVSSLSFYGVTGSVLGVYEAFAKVSGRAPTVTALCARSRAGRAAGVVWAVGLAVHFATKHS